MHRFYLPPSRCQNHVLLLTGREAHHAIHVVRLEPGEPVAVTDGLGQDLLCRTRDFARDVVWLEVVERRSVPAPLCDVTLVQALPKGGLIEEIIEQGTELGLRRLVPLLTERVVVQLDAGSAAAKAERWHSTAVEAVKQCGSAWLPQVDPPLTLKEFLGRSEQFDLSLVASLQPDRQLPRDRFAAFHAAHQRAPRSVAIWIGPEGDFTQPELQSIQTSGAQPITLGRNVLRVVTAAVAALALVAHEIEYYASKAEGTAGVGRAA